jgi:hypothetical protein
MAMLNNQSKKDCTSHSKLRIKNSLQKPVNRKSVQPKKRCLHVQCQSNMSWVTCRGWPWMHETNILLTFIRYTQRSSSACANAARIFLLVCISLLITLRWWGQSKALQISFTNPCLAEHSIGKAHLIQELLMYMWGFP